MHETHLAQLSPYEEFFDRVLRRRRQHADKLGLRTPLIRVHLYECKRCFALIEKEYDWTLQSSEIASILANLHHSGEALKPSACPIIACKHPKLQLVCSSGFAYLSSAEQHIVVFVHHKMTSDGVPHRDMRFIEANTSTHLIECPNQQALRLQQVLAQERVKELLSAGPHLEPKSLKQRLYKEPETLLLALKEYGMFWESMHEYSNAFGYFDAYLQLVPDDEDILTATARILERAQEFSEASIRQQRAWVQHQNPELLETLARLSYRAQRYDLLKGTASALLEEDPDSIPGHLALICSLEAAHSIPLRRAFHALEQAASASGHVGIQQVALSWIERLQHDFPDWERKQSKQNYHAALREFMDFEGWEWEPMYGVELHGTVLECDMIATAPDGTRYLFFLQEGPLRPHVVRAIRGQLRVLMRDDDWMDARPILLTSHPIPWYLYRMMSDAIDARMELLIDADTTMHVIEENVATFLWAAEETYGASLDFSLESLGELDRLILRWHEFGFGDVSHVLTCLMASYLGEIFRRHYGGNWVDAEPGPDARVWRMPDDTLIFLIAHIRHCVALGGDEGIEHFTRSILSGER